MSGRIARWLMLAYLMAYAVVLTYPGIIPFNRVRPMVLGLPFSIFWIALWVALGGLVFWLLLRAEATGRGEE